jgi:YD repeat-containing protein
MMPSSNRRILNTIGLLACFSGGANALTSGPNLPEYTNFESVETTDLVNLSTGNFTWSLPVMTVPGPGLGFPIVLNYHANNGQKDEASWVGLGWNVQAGSITRQVNGIADDFKDVTIIEAMDAGKIYGWSTSIGYNGATVGICYRSDEGYGGMVGYDVLSEYDVPFSLTVTQGFGSGRDQSGVSLGLRGSTAVLKGENSGLGVSSSLSVGIHGEDASVGVGVSLASYDNTGTSASSSASLASMGVSLSQSGGLSAGATIGGVSLGTTVKASAVVESESFAIAIPTQVGVFSFSHSSWTAWIRGYQDDRYFGFLYSDKQGMGCTGTAGSINCHRPTNSGEQMRRHEFMEAQRSVSSDMSLDARLGKGSEDLYLVAAQGISGVVKPFRKEDGDYVNALDKTSKYVCSTDFWFSCGRARADRTERLEIYHNLLNSKDNPITSENGDVYWRYLDDAGGAEYTDPDSRDGYATVGVRSRKVVPRFDAQGKIAAFTVTSANGTVYDFGFTLRNVYEIKVGSLSGDQNVKTTQEIKSAYTYAWLLTSIKSPDYVDADRNGSVGEGDIGGWVSFRYCDGDNAPEPNGRREIQDWMTPYAATGSPATAFTSPSPRTDDGTIEDGVSISSSRNQAAGVKEIAYLHSIETPSHIAYFKTKTGFREDNWPGLAWNQYPITTSDPAYTESLQWLAYPNSDPTLRVHAQVLPGFEAIPGVPDSRTEDGELIDVKYVIRPDYQIGSLSGTECVNLIHPSVTGQQTIVIPNVRVGQAIPAFTIQLWGAPGYNCIVGNGIGYDGTRSIILKRPAESRSKALDNIVLVEKSTRTEVAYAGFQTDYSLCPNTPNSRASTHGKLTLKSVRLGASSIGPFMPDYIFGYSNNPPFQSGSWVEYEKGEWDRWGNKCNTCNDGYHEPSVPFKAGIFDAGAWNLDRINTPTGASLAVKYDAKRYQWIGNEAYAQSIGTNTWQLLVGSGGPEAKRATGDHYDVLENRINFANIRQKLSERGLTASQYRIDVTVEGYKPVVVYLAFESGNNATSLKTWNAQTNQNMTYTFWNPSVNTLWLGGPPGTDDLKMVLDYKLYALINSPSVPALTEDFAGGTVATEVSYREPYGNVVQTTRYKYEDGVTPSLPATFSDYGDSRIRQGRGFEFFQGNPGVFYSKVTTTLNDKNKTEYRFLTPKDLRVMVASPASVSAASNTGGQLSSTVVSDFSSLWGALYQKNEYSDGANPAVVRSFKSIWAYNRKELPTELANALDGEAGTLGVLEEHQQENSSTNYYVSSEGSPGGDVPSAHKYLGEQQSITSHRYFNMSGCYADMSQSTCESNIRTSQVVHKRFLPLASREVTTLDGLQTETFHYYPDFLTGRMLKSRVLNSDNSAVVTSVVPAHQKYSGFTPRNFLDQDYSVTRYQYPPSSRTGKAFNQDESPTNAIASELTLWRPYDSKGGMISGNSADFQAYRIYKNLLWRADLNASPRPGLQIPEDYCHETDGGQTLCNPSLEGDLASEWFLKFQGNRYDGFGHATESMDNSKINETILYGYRSTLPTASLANTGLPNLPMDNKLRAFYESFENDEDVRKKFIGSYASSQYSMWRGNSKTGAKSIKVNNDSPGSMICFDLGALEPKKGYEASVWYFDATEGFPSTSSTATRPGIFLGKDSGCASENHPNGVSGGAGADPGSDNYDSRATGSKQWKRLTTMIRLDQCPDGSQLTPAMVCVYASKGNTGAAVAYDELRVKPAGSQMTTYAYDVRGKMISFADTREVATYYEYDSFGNLTGIRNDDRALVSEQAKRVGKR